MHEEETLRAKIYSRRRQRNVIYRTFALGWAAR
jgi:hypothetical protein